MNDIWFNYEFIHKFLEIENIRKIRKNYYQFLYELSIIIIEPKFIHKLIPSLRKLKYDPMIFPNDRDSN